MNLRTAITCVCSALVLLVGVQVVSAAPAPGVSWATQAGGSGDDGTNDLSALPDGSSIVTGVFSDSATFGSTTLTSTGSNDVFTAKMNADGTWAWATKAGGTGYDIGYGISALPDGSSIVTGFFSGDATFGSTTLTSAGNSDVFTAKMNADGTWAWATQAGGRGGDYGRGVSALPDGSSIVTGYISGDATFGSTTLTSAGSRDVFTAKMNADGTWAWATQAGGSGYDEARGISALPDGSSVVTGYFQGDATFGSTTLTSAGSNDVFTAKMNADGTWAWATQAGGTGGDVGLGISALPDGSSIVTGYFSGDATFGSTTLTSAGSYDVFTAKMNADGTWAWATQAGGTGGDVGYGVSALPDGSSIVTGNFNDTATFGSTTLISGGSDDVFTAKMNADGTWAWATQARGTGGDSATGAGVSALPDGSSIVTGYFDGIATFGNTTLTSAGNFDVFTAKMNADGTWAWATMAGGTGNDYGWGVSALPDGSSIVTGFFGGTATFGSTTLTSAGIDDVFTAKMNADGTWAWATQAGGTGYDQGLGISALPDGSSIVTGFFDGTATFGSTTLTSAGSYDVFTARMNADGTWAWATTAGGTGYDNGVGVSALPDGSSIVTGFFDGTATFGSTTLTSAGSYDVFTARYLDAPQAPAAPVAVAGSASAVATLTPIAGGSVTSYTVTSSPGEQTCTVVAPRTSCTVEGLTNGTSYRFRATATNAVGTGAASGWSNAVTPAATPTASAATVAIKGKVHCVATSCVTTGAVPAGATRITQRATTRPSGRAATGKCTIRRTSTKRTYSCTVRLSRGTWVITTTARTQSTATAHFSKRVQVAPRKAAVTG